uniref:Uncharacterized protein TCIL3000_11_11290 n=1 Tax=Trypanosoma congolense (strain IL3000) TaxID=1068625 RepID=G0V1W9_TRYCI|nr:unnamed protein product [Trypanosoma congolense IL3000]
MFLISWNVAGWGSTARLLRGDFGTLEEFLRHTQADIVCLQEVKGSWQKLKDDPHAMGAGDGRPVTIKGWESFWTFSGKGYRGFNGVATFVRKGLTLWADPRPFTEPDIVGDNKDGDSSGGRKETKNGCVDALNDEGRVLVTCHSAFVLVNIYVVNGRKGERFEYKMWFLSCMKNLLLRLKRETRKPLIFVGDLNMTFHPKDAHWSLRRINFPSLMELTHCARNVTKERWSETLPHITQEALCNMEEFIAEQTSLQLISEIESQRASGTLSAGIDSPLLCVVVANDYAKGSDAKNGVERGLMGSSFMKLVRTVKERERLRCGKVGALASLSELCEGGVTNVFVDTLLRPLPLSHNRELFVISELCGLPPHEELSVNFMKQLLADLNLCDAMLHRSEDEGEKNKFSCPCPYTCWDQSRNKRVANEGTRIDYILVDRQLLSTLVPCQATENNIGVSSPLNARSAQKVSSSCGENDGTGSGHLQPSSSPSSAASFFDDFDGPSYTTALGRVLANGAYPMAPMDGSGLPPLKGEAKFLQFRGLPSTGLFVSPPQYSDHCGICAYFKGLSLENAPGKVKEVHPCLYKPPLSLDSFFTKRPREEQKTVIEIEE